MSDERVTVDDLFRVRSSVDVLDRTYYVRALSELEVQAREEYAARGRAKTARALRDTNSDIYLARLEWLTDAEPEALRATILAAATGDFSRRAFAEFPDVLIPFPDEATQDERDQTLEERETSPVKLAEKRQDWVRGQLQKLTETLKDQDPETLRARAKQAAIETILWNDWVRDIDSYTLYAAVYADGTYTTRLFASPEATREANPVLRQKLAQAYYDELNRISALDVQYFLLMGGSPDSWKPTNSSANGKTPAV